jgi:hypothetical protein
MKLKLAKMLKKQNLQVVLRLLLYAYTFLRLTVKLSAMFYNVVRSKQNEAVKDHFWSTLNKDIHQVVAQLINSPLSESGELTPYQKIDRDIVQFLPINNLPFTIVGDAFFKEMLGSTYSHQGCALIGP